MSRSPLASLSLVGCFASDPWVRADLGRPRRLPRDLPPEVFALAPTPAPEPDPSPTVTVDFSTPVAPHAGETATHAKPGTVLDGKYRLEELLGSGGFADVHRATHLLLKNQVAVKLLHPWLLRRRPHLAEQLCEEACFTALIDHPNVVRVHDVTSGGADAFIVMEFIDGQSLGRLLQHQTLRPINVARLGLQVCAGLAAGLAQGLMHRDIKPGNILLTRQGRAKIVDFGLARRIALDDPVGITVPGAEVVGTPAYMAPEQALDPTSADFRADIYSLGATLYHASVGVPPFSERDPVRVIHHHIHRAPPPLQQVLPAFPSALADVILRMLAKRPEDRPRSYGVLAEELRTALAALGGDPRRTTADAPPTPPTQDRRATDLFGRMRALTRRK